MKTLSFSNHETRYVIGQLIAWGCHNVLYTFTKFGTYDVTLLVRCRTTYVTLMGLMVSHLLRNAYKNQLQTNLSMQTKFLFVVAALFFASILWSFVNLSASIYVWHEANWTGNSLTFHLSYFLRSFSFLFLWSMFYSAASTVFISVDSEMRNAKLQILVRDSQLNQLHAQLNPHFLFNTLNSIQQAMFEAPGMAKEMLEGLKNLLNTTAKYEGVHEITLAEELEVVMNYISIQKIRYEHRLRVNLNVSAELKHYKILPMVIQTLVENAIKHNINRTHKGMVVDIVVTTQDEQLVISIVNDGELKTTKKTQGQGAVNNIRRRLALLYGNNGTLTLENLNCEPERVEARLTMPLIA